MEQLSKKHIPAGKWDFDSTGRAQKTMSAKGVLWSTGATHDQLMLVLWRVRKWAGCSWLPETFLLCVFLDVRRNFSEWPLTNCQGRWFMNFAAVDSTTRVTSRLSSAVFVSRSSQSKRDGKPKEEPNQSRPWLPSTGRAGDVKGRNTSRGGRRHRPLH